MQEKHQRCRPYSTKTRVNYYDLELVINTYGVSIKKENEGFIVSTADDTQRIPAVGIDRILISRGAQITSDAIKLAVAARYL